VGRPATPRLLDDVLACPCGGRRTVTAFVVDTHLARSVLTALGWYLLLRWSASFALPPVVHSSRAVARARWLSWLQRRVRRAHRRVARRGRGARGGDRAGRAIGSVYAAVEATAGTAVVFDKGTFVVAGLPGCRDPARHARVFARCGERPVYFNGTTAMIVAIDKLRVEARGAYRRDATGRYIGRAERARGSISMGPYTLTLDGITYMR
jgi:hypothetical protein